MLTGQRAWSRTELGRGSLEATPGELAALILAALGWNAVTYGTLFLLNGVTAAWVLALVLGGGAVGLATSGWLTVFYQVRAIVWNGAETGLR